MKTLVAIAVAFSVHVFGPEEALAQARVMNPGEAYGQLVFLSQKDVLEASPKFKSLNPYSIPVFAELPMELAVVAGAITLKQQNLLSHVQLKSRARGTPNLDISELPGGLSNPLLSSFSDGAWIHMVLQKNGAIGNGILIEPATPQQAEEFLASRATAKIDLEADLTAKQIFRSQEVNWQDHLRVGSKAANYAELARTLNGKERIVVRPGYMIPFYYYHEFVESNPQIKAAIQDILDDPLMSEVADVSYREENLQRLRDLMTDPLTRVNPALIDQLVTAFDRHRNSNGLPKKMKLRSSTNAEDLPNFNGAGLYSSNAYKPVKQGKELSRAEKEVELADSLKKVWASVWNLRAYEEREFFRIEHKNIKMGVQVNPSFPSELVDGVVVTKNIAEAPGLSGSAVYIEAQRGDHHSVANPLPGVKPEKILVLVNPKNKLRTADYRIHILQRSNVANDTVTVLNGDNLNPVMQDSEIVDLVYQSVKAENHFRPLLGRNKAEFSLDLEFKVDLSPLGDRQVYIKQARPYLN